MRHLNDLKRRAQKMESFRALYSHETNSISKEKTRELYPNISIKLFSKVALFTIASVAKEGSTTYPF